MNDEPVRHVLADGTELKLGMRVKDYDAKYGEIIGPDTVTTQYEHFAGRNREQLELEHVPGERSTCNAWFYVMRDDGSFTSMDCSRMIAEGGRWDR